MSHLLLVLALSGLLMTGCATTPMNEAEIARLTTCKTKNLKVVEKSLSNSGFDIKTRTATTLVTGFRLDLAFRQKPLRKVVVTQAPDGTISFQVRTQDRESNVVAAVAVGVADALHGNDGHERKYFEEDREEYETERREVCGSP